VALSQFLVCHLALVSSVDRLASKLLQPQLEWCFLLTRFLVVLAQQLLFLWLVEWGFLLVYQDHDWQPVFPYNNDFIFP
jgi:hypothetical protein